LKPFYLYAVLEKDHCFYHILTLETRKYSQVNQYLIKTKILKKKIIPDIYARF